MKNYDAWNINPQDFYRENTMEGKIKFLVRFGILAPSSHNTQPWKFKATDGSIKIYADFSRRLPKSDETGRMLYTALGCAGENIKTAAFFYGLKANITYNRGLENSLPEYALELVISSLPADSDREGTSQLLVEAILERSSYRGKYLDIKVPENVLDAMNARNDKKDILLQFFTNPAEKNELSLIAGEGMKNKMADKEFRIELATWVRNNCTRRGDGMPGSGHGMNFLKSLLTPFVLGHIDVSEVEKRKIEKRVMNFPAICVISSRGDNALAWVECGEILERLLLQSYGHDLGASIIAAPIEDNYARMKLRAIIREKAFYPQVFFGFGYSEKKFPHSPRRNLEEVLL